MSVPTPVPTPAPVKKSPWAFLDKLPAWARHLVIVFGAVFLGVIAQNVINHGGVVGLDFVAVGKAALDAAAVSVAAVGVLAVTPFTSQYGVGK